MKLSKQFISASRAMCTLTESHPAPYLRRTISIEKDIQNASLSVCGLGFYRFWLNGTEYTRGHMSPYITNPDNILDYDVYDLTDKLPKGRSVLGFQLGNGMQNCFGGYVWDFEKAPWRSAPKLAVCLEITYIDGTTETVEADESFVCTASPIIYDDIRQGECYDATKEIPHWNLPDFDDQTWTPAIPVETPRGKTVICEANPIVRTGSRKPVAIRKNVRLTYAHNDTIDEGYLYDFGENCAGIPHLKIQGAHGQKISMIFGEYIDKDGNFTVDNIRFVRPEYFDLPLYIQKDEYTCRGGLTEEWEPVFTYHGFRYVLVSGITEEQATETLLTYITMNTDLPERGNFSCSDETLNRLQRMVRLATLANFYHFPTDCPHREKNGWTGDASMSAEHTLLNLDPTANYHEWLRHIRAAMDERGAIPGIIPTDTWGFAWGNGPAWDQVLAVLPYYTYRYRGDKKIAEDNLDALFRYVNYLTTRTDDKGLIAIGLGDWCGAFGPRSPLIFTDSVISMDICEKTAFLFRVCGKELQADFCQRIADNYRTAIRTHLIDWDTMTAVSENTPTPGCETSQAMAIYYHIFNDDEKPAAFQVLLEKIHEQNDHLDTGILGARVIFHVLSDFGYADLAYRIIVDPTYPSYGYFVANGDTALPEDFNRADQTVNSRNHHFFGDISAWFIKSICGIQYNPTATDLTNADIAPHFIDALTHAEAFHDTPMGRICVKWERDAADSNTVLLQITCPECMHGTICFDSRYVCASCQGAKTALAAGTYVLQCK